MVKTNKDRKLDEIAQRISNFVDKCEANGLKPEDPKCHAYLTIQVCDLMYVQEIIDQYLMWRETEAGKVDDEEEPAKPDEKPEEKVEEKK